MTKIKLNERHRIIAAVMALVLFFSAFLWIVPQVQAEELDISDTSVTGFTTPGARTAITNGNLTGGSIGVFVTSTTGAATGQTTSSGRTTTENGSSTAIARCFSRTTAKSSRSLPTILIPKQPTAASPSPCPKHTMRITISTTTSMAISPAEQQPCNHSDETPDGKGVGDCCLYGK